MSTIKAIDKSENHTGGIPPSPPKAEIHLVWVFVFLNEDWSIQTGLYRCPQADKGANPVVIGRSPAKYNCTF